MNIIGQELVQLANESSLIRSYLNVPDWRNIIKITPSSVHRDLGNGQINASFVSGRKYKDSITTNQYIRLIEEGAFKHCYHALERKYGQKVWDDYYRFHALKGLKEKDFAKFAFDTTGNLNPDADPESTCFDGIVRENTDAIWDTIRGDAGDASDDSGSDTNITILASASAGIWSQIARAIFLFDTSSIPAGSTIDSGTFSVVKAFTTTDNFTQSAVLTSSNPALNTAVANGDYDSLGTTDMATARIALSAWDGTETFTLDADGKGNVTANGISKFGLRLSGDIDNSEPTWSASATSIAQMFTADNGSNEPILNITYTPAATATGNMFMIF